MNSLSKTIKIIYLLIAIPLFTSYCQRFNTFPVGYVQKAKVARVIDGDTFVLSDSQRVRILGIDCPEIAKPGKPTQPFGEEAKQKTKNLIEGKTVKLTFENESGNYDMFGRMLAHVWLTAINDKDSLFIQAELLKSGLARIAYYPKGKRYYDLFYNLRRTAIKNKLGIWSHD